MGWVPPPRALSQQEFDKRWEAGARTLKELDPEFWKWKTDREWEHFIARLVIAFVVVGGIGMAVAIRCQQLMNP